MVRVITQETYDEVVKENIDEFEMTPEEAVKEAVAQFEAQGVDLSNIIKDLVLNGAEDHLVSLAIKKLKQYATSEDKDAEILKELEVLKTECNKGLAHRMRASKEGAYPLLIDLLEKRQKKYVADKLEEDGEFIVKVLNTLTAVMETQPDLLEHRGLELIKSILDNVDNDDILIATLSWATTCCIRHEQNRQKVFAKDIGSNLKVLLKTKNVKLLSEALQLLRKMTLDDDIRVEFGKAHEHARDLGTILLEPLTKLLCENTKPPLVSELMLTITCLLVRHELCATVAASGESVLFTVLHDNYDNTAVLRQASKLITALAGNDEVKRSLVKSGIVPILISVLPRHSGDESAAALILKSIAALTLRESEHGKQFLENGAPEVIVECMKKHPESASVQKNACWAIRNMVARCREYNARFHELDAECLLNQAYGRFSQDFGFDIKSALRDLECDVKLDEQWTGKGVQIGNDV